MISRFTTRRAIPTIAVACAITLVVGITSTAFAAPPSPGANDAAFVLSTITPAATVHETTPLLFTLASFDPTSLLGVETAFTAGAVTAPDTFAFGPATSPEEVDRVGEEGAEDDLPEESKRWTFYIEGAAGFSGGNTVARSVDAKFDIRRKWTLDAIYIFGRVEWAEGKNSAGDMETIASRATAGLQYDRKFDEFKTAYWFARQDFERDPFADIRFRSNSWVGVGDILYAEGAHEVKGEVAPGYSYTDFFNATTNKGISARFWEGWNWAISKDWELAQGFEFIWNLQEWDDDFRTNFTTDVRTKLSESVWLSFGVEHRYNAEPGTDDDGDRAKRNDWNLLAKVGFAF